MALNDDPAPRLGRRLRAARLALGRSQRTIGRRAGVSQPVISRMELGGGGAFAVDTLAAVAAALGMRLDIDIVDASDTDLDRHERCHAMVAEVARSGGWSARTTIREGHGDREIETILRRGNDSAVVRVWDPVTRPPPELGRFEASVDRERRPGTRAAGFILIPATGSNRRRVSESRDALRTIFPAPAREWFGALIDDRCPMPTDPGILWSFPDCGRLRPSTFAPGWIWTAVGDGPRFVTGRRDRAQRAG